MILFNISGCRRKNSWFSRKIYLIGFISLAWEISRSIFRHTQSIIFIFVALSECPQLIWVDFYISATDFLEIEIYYNKKHLFLDLEISG